MRRPLRRRVIVPAAVALVMVAVAAGTAWYLLSEERRMGSTIARLLAGRAGLPITIERASWNGRRLLLRGVHLSAGAELPVDVRVSRMEIDANPLTLVSPAGRTVSVVATSASVTLVPSSAPTGGGVDAARARLLDVLGWPGGLTMRVERGRIRSAGSVLTFDLDASKQGPALTLALTLTAPGDREPLRLGLRAAAALGASVDLVLDVAGSPRLVTAVWPEAPLPASAVGGRVQLQVAAAGAVSADGKLTLGPDGAATTLDFAARYEATSGDLTVSRYALRRGDEIRLAGTARWTRAAGGSRLWATADGDVAGSKVDAKASYDFTGGAFDGDVGLDPVDGDRVRRLGIDVPLQLSARQVRARVAGRVASGTTTARVDATASSLTTALRPGFTVGASLAATVTVERGREGLGLRRVDGGRLALTREGRSVLDATLSSPAGAPWPLAVDATAGDLSAWTPLVPMATSLAGTARVRGSLASASPPVFRGSVDARLPHARLQLGGPVELSDVRLQAPLTVGVPGDPPPGALVVSRAVAYGIALEDLTGQARLADDRVLLSDLLYSQYGGHGTGWFDATRRATSPPFRGRLEGSGVDLARLVSQWGSTGTRVTGTVKYVATTQYLPDQGLLADAQVDSTSGGEVSIEAIEGLLSWSSVQSESTGILKRTLQNLRAFEYESLQAHLRYRGGAGYIDLALRGKKRFGIFPAPVEALNFYNVPVALLVRTITKGPTP